MSAAEGTPAGPLPFSGVQSGVRGRLWRSARLFVRRKPLGAAAAVILALVLVVAAFPSAFATHNPTAQAPQDALQRVSGDHLFGTDNFGRDVYSRVIYGTRHTITIAIGAVLVGITVATVLGAASAYFGGWVDVLVQRLVDAVMALPWLVVLMSVMALVGPGTVNTLLVIGLLTAPGASRVVRSVVLGLVRREYIEAARVIACPVSRILWRHILPNLTTTLLVLASTGLGAAMLSEASLAFLGFGVVPPAPAWGYMLGVEGRRFLIAAPWLAIFPGAAIALAVLGINVLSDALRDLLDPRSDAAGIWPR